VESPLAGGSMAPPTDLAPPQCVLQRKLSLLQRKTSLQASPPDDRKVAVAGRQQLEMDRCRALGTGQPTPSLITCRH
jgi:hypothetical protein